MLSIIKVYHRLTPCASKNKPLHHHKYVQGVQGDDDANSHDDSIS